MIKRILYILAGVVVLGVAISFSFMFYDELPYFLSSQTAQIRVIGTLIAWIYGISALYYGIKPGRTNVFSHLSLALLICSPIASGILSFWSCNIIGRACTTTEALFSNLSRGVLEYGLVLCFIALLVSFFIRRERIQTP